MPARVSPITIILCACGANGTPRSHDAGPADAAVTDAAVTRAEAGPDAAVEPRCDPEPDSGVELACDQDGDRYMSEPCGGDDCDDHDPAVRPWAPEPSGWDIETASGRALGPLDVALGPNGDLHVVLQGGWPYPLRHATGAWADWSFENVTCRRTVRPQIAVAPDGTLHFIYVLGEREQRAGSLEHAWSVAEGSFAEETIVSADAEPRSPAVAIGPDGTVHAAWTSGTATLVYGWRDESGWDTEVIEEGNVGDVSMGVSAAGDIHVVYGQTSPEWTYSVRHAVRRDTDWMIELLAEPEFYQGGAPSLVVMPDDTVHVAYGGGYDATYATNASGQWTFDHDVFAPDHGRSAIGLAVGRDGSVIVAGERPGPSFTHCLAVSRRAIDGWTVHEINCGFFAEDGVGLWIDESSRAHALYFSNGLRHAMQVPAGEGRDQNCDGIDG